MEIIDITIEKEDSGIRIDAFLGEYLDDFSRNYIQKIISNGNVEVNGKSVKKSFKLSVEDEIRINLPEPMVLDVKAENIPIDIVYEDEDIMVIDKKKGMVVHPAPGNYEGTLVNAIMFHSERLSDINGVIRPGIVHRIDKDTTGLLVITKNNDAHSFISDLLKEHDITRKYVALVHGKVKEDEGTVDQPIGRNPKNRLKMAVVGDGKRAVTHYRVLERYKGYTLIECILETGRTHQIRVHMRHIGHPLAGDPVYGVKKEKFKVSGQLLHARTLGFIHPRTKEYIELSADIHEEFKGVLSKLEVLDE